MSFRAPEQARAVTGTSGSDTERNAEDVALARRVVAGDEAAWESFIARYSGLIHAIARRYLRSRDPDEVQTLFVDVLAAVRRGKLRTYEGRASLSTWLTLVTRSAVMDHLRHRFGRAHGARVLARLSPLEQRLFRLYYVEGRSAGEVVDELDRPGDPWTIERFMAGLRQIERQLGDRWLRRLAYDLYAQSVGASSGRLLEYLDHVRDEYEQRSGAFSPDYHLMEREAKRTTGRLQEALAELPPKDRAVLEMRFERGWSAPQIAEELGLDQARGVYTTIDRIVRRLRRSLRREE